MNGPKRGTFSQPRGRFEKMDYDPVFFSGLVDASLPEEDLPSPKTQFLKDNSKSILAHNQSPDIGFSTSINPYRGCEHGCIYCYARPTHEYFGLSAGIDFETKIFVKENAAELLRSELSKKSYRPEAIAISGVTDCYQPVERKLEITRSCLKVLAEFRNPVSIITKNKLVTRDIDLLKVLAAHQAAAVFVSVTTLDAELAGKMEPRTSRPQARLDAIRELTEAGIPVGVLCAPVIPGLTDHEMPSILASAASAGARYAGFTPLRLPYGVAPLFMEWVELYFPEKKSKIESRLHSLRGGKLNDSEFHSRMKGEGIFAQQLQNIFDLVSRKLKLNRERLQLSTEAFRVPGAATQMGLGF